MKVEDMLFVAFNRRIAALDPRNGDVLWKWKSEKGIGFVSILLDRGTLYASVQGYTYAIDPRDGSTLWMNSMPGFGYGIPMLATVRSQSDGSALAAMEQQETETSD